MLRARTRVLLLALQGRCANETQCTDQGGGGSQLEPNMQRAATRMHPPLLTGIAPYRYRHEDGTTLPLCITQYFPSGSEGQYTRVTLETLDPVSQAKSADLAHAWSKGAQSWAEEGMHRAVALVSKQCGKNGVCAGLAGLLGLIPPAGT